MKVETIVTYTEEDKVLLNKDLPTNPCDNCSARYDGSCCGCPNGRAYNEEVQPYKDAKIYDLALDIKRAKHILEERERLQKEFEDLKATFPDFVEI